MSILSSLYHHSIRNKPNEVHNQPEESAAGPTPAEREAQACAAPESPTACTDGSAVLTDAAQRRLDAAAEGNTRPALYYTAQEQKPCASGVWESPHTVASKLESKEEYPQG